MQNRMHISVSFLHKHPIFVSIIQELDLVLLGYVHMNEGSRFIHHQPFQDLQAYHHNQILLFYYQNIYTQQIQIQLFLRYPYELARLELKHKSWHFCLGTIISRIQNQVSRIQYLKEIDMLQVYYSLKHHYQLQKLLLLLFVWIQLVHQLEHIHDPFLAEG